MNETLKRLRELHARFGAVVRLDREPGHGVPDGWSVVARRWARGTWWSRGIWDALIVGPGDHLGWRLGGDFARSRREAVRRAAAEIRAHDCKAAGW